MELAFQGTARGSTREAGGGKVIGAVSNSSFLSLLFAFFPSLPRGYFQPVKIGSVSSLSSLLYYSFSIPWACVKSGKH